MHWLVAPGLLASAPVRQALLLGFLIALTAAVVGVFVVVRGQSFAGHALTDVATTGGAGAALYGLTPLVGFLTGAVAGAGAMELIGRERAQRRDVATGVVLGGATGLSGLFLYLSATTTSSTGVTQRVLFGSLFSVSSAMVPAALLIGALVLVVMAIVARPLLLSSVSPDIATARGLSPLTLGLAFLLVAATTVGLCALAIGSILSTALLIGPAAAALKVTRSLRSAIIVASVLGVAATWAGIVLSYDSYTWGSSHQGLPVSFFVVALILLTYGLCAWRRARSTRV